MCFVWHGLGVPSLRSLWGAEPQLYILLMCWKNCISFNFSIFVIIYTTYRKKKLHAFTAKKFHFFSKIVYTTYRKKKLHAFTAKKNYTPRQFFCTRLTFFTLAHNKPYPPQLFGLIRAQPRKPDS